MTASASLLPVVGTIMFAAVLGWSCVPRLQDLPFPILSGFCGAATMFAAVAISLWWDARQTSALFAALGFICGTLVRAALLLALKKIILKRMEEKHG